MRAKDSSLLRYSYSYSHSASQQIRKQVFLHFFGTIWTLNLIYEYYALHFYEAISPQKTTTRLFVHGLPLHVFVLRHVLKPHGSLLNSLGIKYIVFEDWLHNTPWIQGYIGRLRHLDFSKVVKRTFPRLLTTGKLDENSP